MRDLPEEIRQRQAGENPVRAQQMQRADRAGAFPAERCAAFQRQRLGQDQPAVERIRKAQTRRDPERQAWIHAAKQAANGGTENEARAERSTNLAEHRGAPFRRRHIGDIGKGGRDARRGDSGNHPADEQPDQRRRQRHQHIVQRQSEIRQQYHRPPAEPVRERAKDRREQKLHQRPGGAEQAENPRRRRRVVVDKTFHEFWQDRQDQAERQHIEQDGNEDEGRRAAAHRRLVVGNNGGRLFAHDGRLRLWANGLAFSRSVIRIGVPGRSKASRMLLVR